MSNIERIDFSKPPPGYELTQLDDGMWWWGETSEWLDGTSYMDHEMALKAAWAHYKSRHDPPGMWSGCCAVLPLCDQYRPRMGVSVPGVAHLELYVNAERPNSPEEARLHGRAAAWLVYEDAVEVADLLDHDRSPVGHRDVWPRPLAWTAEERAAVKWWVNWHIKTGQKVARPPSLPEVLRGI